MPALVERLSDPNPAVRDATTYALRDIGTDARTAGPALAGMSAIPIESSASTPRTCLSAWGRTPSRSSPH